MAPSASPQRPLKPLIVDDDEDTCSFLTEALTAEGAFPTTVRDPRLALQVAREAGCDCVLSDLSMPGRSGLALCADFQRELPELPFVVMTAFGSVDVAVQAMKAGAADFVVKPFDVEALVLVLERAREHRALIREVTRLRQAVSLGTQYGQLVGQSTAMREVYDLLSRLADSDVSLLIMGESGTGKDLVARELHRSGRRKAGPFVAINCAAMPENLLEAELFGHERGAFTDAKTARSGLFLQANGGTLFLDEIGEMPQPMQAKLLRALQDRAVRPIGASREIPFDVRLVCATNRDLEGAILERSFREDLYYRINVVQVRLPPLRSRGGDVVLLARQFLAELSEAAPESGSGGANLARSRGLVLSQEAERLLGGYDWPGNVRELRNCVERAVALCRGPEILAEDLPEKVRLFAAGRGRPTLPPGDLVPLALVEQRHILAVLSACGGHKSRAAEVLGLSRKTLYRKLEEYALSGAFVDAASRSGDDGEGSG